MSAARNAPAHRRRRRQNRSLAARVATLFRITGKPSWYVLVLTVAVSAGTVFNQTTLPHLLGYGAVIQLGVNLLLGLAAFYGIGPVAGPKFKAFVHLPANVAGAIGFSLLIGEIAVQRTTGTVISAIVLGLIQFAGGLGFAPAYIPTA